MVNRRKLIAHSSNPLWGKDRRLESKEVRKQDLCKREKIACFSQSISMPLFCIGICKC